MAGPAVAGAGREEADGRTDGASRRACERLLGGAAAVPGVRLREGSAWRRRGERGLRENLPKHEHDSVRRAKLVQSLRGTVLF